MKKVLQQTAGYIIGGSVVGFIIPYGIYSAAKRFDPIFGIELFQLEQLRIPLAFVLLLIGFAFGIWSVVIQNTVGKGGPLQVGNIQISPKTQNLVVTGPYKYTRNPMLFGACLMYFAFAFYLNSITAVIVVVLFMIFMLIFVKLSEEKRLLKDFGEPYKEYRRNVSMFIPWIPKRCLSNRKRFMESNPEVRHNILRRLLQLVLVDVFTTVFLFASAGTFHWFYAGVYIALCWLVTLSAPFVAPLEILAERGSKKENVEKWDGVMVRLLGLSGFAIYVVAGLDFRWHWTSELSMGIHTWAILFFLLGFILMVWAMFVNRFFSTVVRIQFDRGHEVCTQGPYRYIRHPGYLGMILYYLATPVFLGSLWAVIPAFTTMLLLVIRTMLEDKTLVEKLPGYKEYANQTRYRLLPGIW